jgi:hypothetical protein
MCSWDYLLLGILLVQLFLPAISFYSTRRDFISLMHDNLGLGQAWSEFLSIPVSILQVSMQTAALGWLLIGRMRPFSIAAVLVVFGTTPLLHALLDTNFNQTTGAVQKYYVRRAGGEILLSDTGGVDPETGIERRALTSQIAQIIEREKRGIRPRPVVGDVRSLTYFNATSGHPLIWFSLGGNGEYRLFDAEGFSPYDGSLLRPINEQIVARITEAANLSERETHLAEQRKIEAAEQERNAKARLALQEQLGVSGFPPDSVVIGAKPVSVNDQASAELARNLLDQLDDRLRARSLHTAQFPLSAYASPTYSLIMDGRMEALAGTGLTDDGRTIIAMTVEAECSTASSVAGLVSCAGRAMVRSVNRTVVASQRQTWVERGAGISRRDALTQTAEFLVQRHIKALLDDR